MLGRTGVGRLSYCRVCECAGVVVFGFQICNPLPRSCTSIPMSVPHTRCTWCAPCTEHAYVAAIMSPMCMWHRNSSCHSVSRPRADFFMVCNPRYSWLKLGVHLCPLPRRGLGLSSHCPNPGLYSGPPLAPAWFQPWSQHLSLGSGRGFGCCLGSSSSSALALTVTQPRLGARKPRG